MIEKFKSKVSLKIKGRNINRFIKKLTTKKINILSLNQINRNEVKILIYKEDYEEVLKIKSEKVGLLDMKKIDELYRLGYQQTKKFLKSEKGKLFF